MNKWLAENQNSLPVLEATALQRLCQYGKVEAFRAGDILISQGEPLERFFAVLQGTVAVEQAFETGNRLVATHGRGEFFGEINSLSGELSLVTGRAETDCSVLSLDRLSLRSLIEADPALGEVIVGAFILRRLDLLTNQKTGTQHSTPARCEDTLNLRAFLLRNGFHWLH